MKPGKRLLLRINRVIRRCLFSRRSFIRAVFGARMVAPFAVQTYCEWPSILQRLVVKRYIHPGARILDMGAGAHALLAIFIKKRFPGASVLASDVVPERVAWAGRTVEDNGVDVSCVRADVFKGLSGRFDLILFAPPVIPTGELAELGLEWKSHPGLGVRRCWSGDGGPDGLDIIRVFLKEVSSRLTPNGRAVLSINPIYCRAVRAVGLARDAGLVVQRIHRLPGIANSYVLATDESLKTEAQ